METPPEEVGAAEKPQPGEVPATAKTPFEAVFADEVAALYGRFKDLVEGDPVQLRTAAITLLVGLMTLILLYMVAKRLTQRKKQVVVLVGHSNSGKTTLFSKLTGSDWIGTVPSLTANYGSLGKIAGEDFSHVQLVDLPGNPILERRIPPHLKNASLIIFMIDSSQFPEEVSDIAKKLFMIMDHPRFKSGKIPMLIAANKADLGSRCSTDKFIQKMLQKEIGAVMARETGQKDPRPFEFESLSAPITLTKTSMILEDGMGGVNVILKKYLK